MAMEENISNSNFQQYEDDKEKCLHHHSLPDPDEATTSKGENATLRHIAGVAGNLLEWYDFALFGSFSDIIGDAFFPPQEGNAAIIESFTVFATAFLFRPVGGMVIGYIGDKYGKKKALEISVFLMAVPTFAMGCIPPFSTIGWGSTILLILVRIMQGLSAGGQLMSSLLFTVNPHPKSQWGYYGSFVFATANCGSFLGSLVGFVMRENMDEDDLRSWGWRLPFLFGIVVAFSAVYLKFYCEDEDMSHVNDQEQATNPIKESLKSSNRRALFSCILVPSFYAAGNYLTFTWLPIYMNSMLVPPVPHAFGITCLSNLIFFIIALPMLGMLSDKNSHIRMMIIGACTVAIIGPFMILLIGVGSVYYAFLSQSVLGLTVALWTAPMGAWLADSFPENIRLTAISLAYNIALLVGGFSPAIATLMVDHIGISSPGYLYTIMSMYSLIGLLTAQKFGEAENVNENNLLVNAENDVVVADEEAKKEDDFSQMEKRTRSPSALEHKKEGCTKCIVTASIT